MNKFSELIDESKGFEEIEDNIIPISDVLGKPNLATINYGDQVGYVFQWKLDFNVEDYNGLKEVQDILTVFDCIKELSHNMKRIEGYDVEFKIDKSLYVRITPQTQESKIGYKFIEGQNWKYIIINYGQVARFFKDRGYNIRNTKSDENPYEETISITINTDAPDYVTNQFKELFANEIEVLYDKEESIDKKIDCTTNTGMVYIFPKQEKTYIVFNNQL